MSKANHLFQRVFLAILFVALPGALLAVSPPALINYQGVLRSAADEPLTGTYDMTFRFFDAASAGNEVLVDQHLAANTQAVMVDGGMFSVGLGGGAVADGSGPGTYTSLANVFRDFGSVWLEVQVGAEVLSPRTQVMAGAYALNASTALSTDQLAGQPASFYLDTSATAQTKAGTVQFHAADPSVATVEAVGDAGSTGALNATNSSGSYCRLAWGNVGAECGGANWGAYFYDTTEGSYMHAAYGNDGLVAVGPSYGGYMTGTGPTSIGVYGGGGTGVYGTGTAYGGHFYASAGTATGVSGQAAAYGGYFYASGATSTGVYGLSPYYGGHFRNSVSGAEAFVGTNTYALDVYGPGAAKFTQFSRYGSTLIGYAGYSVYASSESGLRASDIFDGSYSLIGHSPYKIQGNGSVSFVQNHPDDPTKVVIYHAPESSEVNVYTRGSAKLVDGVARVALDPTFQWTANPDIGLTAHLTPRGEPVALAVESVTTKDLVVRGPKGSDVAFDFWVTGLRIGFEQMPAVAPKENESAIPARATGDDVYESAPGLRAFNALERYRTMARDLGAAADPDMKAAASLRDRIGIGRPVDPKTLPGASSTTPDTAATAVTGAGMTLSADGASAPVPSVSAPSPILVPRTSEKFVAVGPIEAGEVVVLDPAVPGAVRRCEAAADAKLVGVAVNRNNEGTVEVAFAAIHEVLVNASDHPIAVGDLLTTSAMEGTAMHATADAPGTILGKALEPLQSGIGTIRVLLMPR
jgi:hypothetical protein